MELRQFMSNWCMSNLWSLNQPWTISDMSTTKLFTDVYAEARNLPGTLQPVGRTTAIMLGYFKSFGLPDRANIEWTERRKALDVDDIRTQASLWTTTSRQRAFGHCVWGPKVSGPNYLSGWSSSKSIHKGEFDCHPDCENFVVIGAKW